MISNRIKMYQVFVFSLIIFLFSINVKAESTMDSSRTPVKLHLNELNLQLAYASHSGDFEQVKLFIKLGADVNNSVDEYNGTALGNAAGEGHLEIVKYLVEKAHANINLKPFDGGYTILDTASRGGNLDVISYLIDKGADVNFTDNRGDTALINVSREGNLKVAKLLVDAGADINFQNDQKESAVTVAEKNAHSEVVIYLKKHGLK